LLEIYFKKKKEINASKTYSPWGRHAARAKQIKWKHKYFNTNITEHTHTDTQTSNQTTNIRKANSLS